MRKGAATLSFSDRVAASLLLHNHPKVTQPRSQRILGSNMKTGRLDC
jgi:hypothetical protein